MLKNCDRPASPLLPLHAANLRALTHPVAGGDTDCARPPAETGFGSQAQRGRPLAVPYGAPPDVAGVLAVRRLEHQGPVPAPLPVRTSRPRSPEWERELWQEDVLDRFELARAPGGVEAQVRALARALDQAVVDRHLDPLPRALAYVSPRIEGLVGSASLRSTLRCIPCLGAAAQLGLVAYNGSLGALTGLSSGLIAATQLGCAYRFFLLNRAAQDFLTQMARDPGVLSCAVLQQILQVGSSQATELNTLLEAQGVELWRLVVGTTDAQPVQSAQKAQIYRAAFELPGRRQGAAGSDEIDALARQLWCLLDILSERLTRERRSLDTEQRRPAEVV
jgi:hypothetical protein